MSNFKTAGTDKLESIVRFRVKDDVKILLKEFAKRLKIAEPDAGRYLLEEALTGQFATEKVAQERFEELQTEHKAILTNLHTLAEKLELTHQMASSVLAYVASRELNLRSGTKEEVLEQTKKAVNIGVALGCQVSERHKLGQLGKG